MEEKTKKEKKEPEKKLFRFCGYYNNISIGPNIKFDGIKMVLHEVLATSCKEAFEMYKLYLMSAKGIPETKLRQYLIDTFYNAIEVEVLSLDGISVEKIPLA